MSTTAPAIASRAGLEDIRKNCYSYQMRVCSLLKEPFEPADDKTQYLVEVYSVAGHLISIIDEYMYGAGPDDEVYLTKADLSPITSFTRAMASAARLLKREYNISLVTQ
tara:strand:+ start:154 stop:480 length:327 start_codon:yes stop_codon:yes gene_type:complete